MIARGAWIPGIGTYTIEDSTAPQDPTAGHVRFGPDSPSRMDLKSGGNNCGERLSVEKLEGHNHSGFGEFLKVASLANLAAVKQNPEGTWEAHGDPTEIAIQVFAARFGMNRSHLVKGDAAQWEDLIELPFDSDVKRMSVIMRHIGSSTNHAFTKGAVERVIQSCTTYLADGKDQSQPVTEEFRKEILSHMQALAGLGLRVLALASKKYPGDVEKGAEVERASVESELVFRGLIGLYDPPRPESAVAVRQCHEAGIEVHMLTGDHPGKKPGCILRAKQSLTSLL
jgi:Na+-exporting ATPase